MWEKARAGQWEAVWNGAELFLGVEMSLERVALSPEGRLMEAWVLRLRQRLVCWQT